MKLPTEVAAEARKEARECRALREDLLADLLGECAWWLDRLGADVELPREDPQFDDHYEGHGTRPEDWR